MLRKCPAPDNSTQFPLATLQGPSLFHWLLMNTQVDLTQYCKSDMTFSSTSAGFSSGAAFDEFKPTGMI